MKPPRPASALAGAVWVGVVHAARQRLRAFGWPGTQAARRGPGRAGLVGWLAAAWLLALAGLLPLPAWALAAGALPPAPPVQAVALPAERLPVGLPLQGRVALLADASGQWTLEQVRQAHASPGWHWPSGSLHAVGSTVWWQRIVLEQRPGADAHWLLELPTTALRDVTFYGPFDAAGRALAAPQFSGLIHPHAQRRVVSERALFALHLPEPGVYTVYLRVQSSIMQRMTPTLWQLPEHHLQRQHQRLFDGVVYGFLLALILINLALAPALRDQAFTFFALMSLAGLFSLLSFNGHAAQYLWPHQPWWVERSFVLFPAMWLLASAGFAHCFLNAQQRQPGTQVFLLVLAALALCSVLLGLLGLTRWAQHLNEGLALGGSAALALIAALLWRRGFVPARWYLLGNLAPFVAIAAVVSVNWGVLDWLMLQYNALEIGILLQSLVYAAALGTRVAFVQRENLRLSQRVHRLAAVAATDPLTGLANRRGLADLGQTLLQRPGTHALALFDLNRFKPINDTLGHAAGDAVLVEVARRLKRHSRARDVVARLGGDEFVLLLIHCPARPELDAMVERLRAVLDEPVAYGEHRLQVSASVGVALAPADGRELHALLRAADWAMYAAKLKRERVRFAADTPATRPPTAAPDGSWQLR